MPSRTEVSTSTTPITRRLLQYAHLLGCVRVVICFLWMVFFVPFIECWVLVVAHATTWLMHLV